MRHDSSLISAFIFLGSATLLSACGSSESKDEVMGGIITDCQMSAHGALEGSDLNDEKKHFVLGEYVERCLKGSGLQPSAQNDASCFESPQSTENGNGFIKPLQKCWKNVRGAKS